MCHDLFYYLTLLLCYCYSDVFGMLMYCYCYVMVFYVCFVLLCSDMYGDTCVRITTFRNTHMSHV